VQPDALFAGAHLEPRRAPQHAPAGRAAGARGPGGRGCVLGGRRRGPVPAERARERPAAPRPAPAAARWACRRGRAGRGAGRRCRGAGRPGAAGAPCRMARSRACNASGSVSWRRCATKIVRDRRMLQAERHVSACLCWLIPVQVECSLLMRGPRLCKAWGGPVQSAGGVASLQSVCHHCRMMA